MVYPVTSWPCSLFVTELINITLKTVVKTFISTPRTWVQWKHWQLALQARSLSLPAKQMPTKMTPVFLPFLPTLLLLASSPTFCLHSSPKTFRNYFPYKETQRDADTGLPACLAQSLVNVKLKTCFPSTPPPPTHADVPAGKDELTQEHHKHFSPKYHQAFIWGNPFRIFGSPLCVPSFYALYFNNVSD